MRQCMLPCVGPCGRWDEQVSQLRPLYVQAALPQALMGGTWEAHAASATAAASATCGPSRSSRQRPLTGAAPCSPAAPVPQAAGRLLVQRLLMAPAWRTAGLPRPAACSWPSSAPAPCAEVTARSATHRQQGCSCYSVSAVLAGKMTLAGYTICDFHGCPFCGR